MSVEWHATFKPLLCLYPCTVSSCSLCTVVPCLVSHVHVHFELNPSRGIVWLHSVVSLLLLLLLWHNFPVRLVNSIDGSALNLQQLPHWSCMPRKFVANLCIMHYLHSQRGLSSPQRESTWGFRFWFRFWFRFSFTFSISLVIYGSDAKDAFMSWPETKLSLCRAPLPPSSLSRVPTVCRIVLLTRPLAKRQPVFAEPGGSSKQ